MTENVRSLAANLIFVNASSNAFGMQNNKLSGHLSKIVFQFHLVRGVNLGLLQKVTIFFTFSSIFAFAHVILLFQI